MFNMRYDSHSASLQQLRFYLTPTMIILAPPPHLARTVGAPAPTVYRSPVCPTESRTCHPSGLPSGVACATHPATDGFITTSTACVTNINSCAHPYYTTHNVIQATPMHPQRASGSLEGQRYLERERKSLTELYYKS